MRLFNRSSNNSSIKSNRTKNILFDGPSHSENLRNPKTKGSHRSLRLEALEERQLLSVTPAEYNEIRATFPDISLPENSENVNIIEVRSLTSESLNNAIATAAQTPENDLIYVRNNSEVLELNSPVVVDLDSNQFGDLMIVGSGAGIQIKTENAAFDVLAGNVQIANVVLTDDSPATATILLNEGSNISANLTTSMTNFHETINSNNDPNQVATPDDYSPDFATATANVYQWANTAAQVLWSTGWAEACGFSTVNDVAEYIGNNFAGNPFTVNNASVEDLVEWFLTGDIYDISARFNGNGNDESHITSSVVHKNNVDGGGYFPELNYDAIGQYVPSSTAIMGEADAALDADTAVAFELTSINTDKTGTYQWRNGRYSTEYMKTKSSLTISDVVTEPISTANGGLHNPAPNSADRYYAVWVVTDDMTHFRFSKDMEYNGQTYAALPYAIEWDDAVGQYVFAVEPIIDVDRYDDEGNVTQAWIDAYWALRNSDAVYNAFCQGRLTYIDTGVVMTHLDYNYNAFGDARRTAIVAAQDGENRFSVDNWRRIYNDEGVLTEDNRMFETFVVEGLVCLQNYYTPISPYSINSTLTLQSNPTSEYNLIYLDFSVMGLDGFSDSISFQENIYIQQIWQMVAEDFMPFNVNITTDLNVYNDYIARRDAAEAEQEGAGAAYTILTVNVGNQLTNAGWFGASFYTLLTNTATNLYTGNRYTPLEYFGYASAGAISVSDYGMVAKAGAEWASYNAGGQLGLRSINYNYEAKDVYAPIMAFPATLNKEFTQWSCGEYYCAEPNPQDQLAILGTRLGFRVDENNGTISMATPLTIVDYGQKYDVTRNRYGAANGTEDIGIENDSSQGTYLQTGVISNRNDTDSYSFIAGKGITGGGQYVIDISGVGADERWIDSDYLWGSGSYYNWDWGYTNLNLKVQLIEVLDDGTENILVSQTRNVQTAFSHFVTPVLEAGKTYYIRIDGEGQGNGAANGFTDYASLGSYTLKVTEYYDNLVDDDNNILITTLEDNVALDNAVSLREASMYVARRLEDGSYVQPTVIFNTTVVNDAEGNVIFDDLSDGTIVLNPDYGQWVLNKHVADHILVFDAFDARITIDADARSRVLLVDGISAEIVGLTLTNGLATEDVPGGYVTPSGYYASYKPYKSYSGGGVFVYDSWFTMRDCIVAGNAAYESGGGILNHSGYRQILQNNLWPAVEYFGHLNMVNSLVVGNTTTYYNPNTDLWINDASSGGGIFNWVPGDLDIVNCTIAGNSSVWAGGGITNLGGQVNIDNSIIAGNTVRASDPTGTYGHGADIFWYDENSYTGQTTSFNVTNSLIGNVSFDATIFGTFYGKMFDGENNIIGTYDAVVDPGFALFRMYDWETREWTSSYWKDWNFLILGNSPAVNSGNNTLWLEYWGNYWDSNIRQSREDYWNKYYSDEGNLTPEQIEQEVNNKLTVERQEFLDDKLNNSVDLAENERFNDSIIDMGAYEYVAYADLLPTKPRRTITEVETDWAEPMVIAKNDANDRTGFGSYSTGETVNDIDDYESVAYSFDDLYLSFSFMNLGRSADKDVHITLYQIFDDVYGYLPGEKITLLELVITNPYIPGTVVLDSTIQVNYNGERLADISYNDSGEIVYKGEVIGNIIYNKNGLIQVESLFITKLFNDPKMKGSEFPIFPGQYTFRAVLDSTNVIEESDETNNIFSTTVNIHEYPYSQNMGIVVTTNEDIIDPMDNWISLREAILYANDEYSRITFADYLKGETIQIDAEEYGRLEITKSVTIDASDSWDIENDQPGITLDGLDLSQILYVGMLDGATEIPEVSIDSISFVRGFFEGSEGAAITNEASLSLTDVFVQDNVGLNGAVYNLGTITVYGSSFIQNSAENGGAIYNAATGTALLINSELYGNVAQKNGGAFYNLGTFHTINCTITGNSALFGGGLYNNAVFVADNTIFAWNFASESEAKYDVFHGENAILQANYSFIGAINVDLSGGQFVQTVQSVASNININYDNLKMFVVDPILNANGVLTNLDELNLQLHPYSAAVNRGADSLAVDSDNVPLVSDIVLNERFVETVDMGAYELQEIVKPDLSFFNRDDQGEQTVVYDNWGAPAVIVYDGERDRTTQRDLFYSDQDLFVNLSMFNIGTAPVMDNFTWQILVDDEFLYEGVYPGHDQQSWVFPDGTIVYYNEEAVNIGSLPVGEGHIFRFILNAGNSIDESDYDNNIYQSVSIDVRELPSTVVTTYSDVVDPYDDKISLREALAYANMVLFTGDVIDNVVTFDKAALDAEAEITGISEFILVSGQLEIDSSLTIDGDAFWTDENGEPGVTINGKQLTRLFNIAALDANGEEISVEFNKLRLTNGEIVDNGAAIYNAGKLTIKQSVFNNNLAKGDGGAVYNEGSLTITDSSFLSNKAENGGSVFSVNSFELTDIQVYDNFAEKNGGAIYSNADLTATNITLSNSHAITGDGGAIYSVGNLNITSANLLETSAGKSGGAVYSVGTATITDLTLGTSTAGVDGGAVYCGDGSTITGLTLVSSAATEGSGGVIYGAGSLTVENLTITNGSSAGADGGAIYSDGDLTLTTAGIQEITTAGKSGGAVYSVGTATITDLTLGTSTAGVDGGAVYCGDGSTITDLTLGTSTAGVDGGAVYC
ncbi:MAG: hypothetical protein Q4C95_08440, partial [Planctomycetia bacterium]|nr:hypothetical protein [Planctomycetia bacterium]